MDYRLDRADKVDYERRLMLKAVWYYYIENYTQQHISSLLGVSRSKVINLLERARQTGAIQFNVQQESAHRMSMEAALVKRFGLQDTFIVPRAGTLTDPNDSIAQAAAMYILHRAEENAFINIGYGDTTSHILNYLATAAQLPINAVSMTGGVNYYLPNAVSNVFNARLYLIPSPLLLSNGALRDSLRREPDVEELFRMIPLSSMSVVGIGSMNEQATILKSGILNKNDFTYLKMRGAVGDILSHFLDRNGELVSPELEGRLMSTPLEQLKELDNVIGAAGGPDKAEAILAALRGGYLDVLITDEGTAQQLLDAPDP